MSENNQKSTYGIIALVIAVGSLFVPRIFVSIVLLAAGIFIVLGFIRDSYKIWSAIAVFVAAYTLSLFAKQDYVKQVQNESLYEITYKVSCASCSVTFTNQTGGDDQIDIKPEGPSYTWTSSVTAKGDSWVRLNASTHRGPVLIEVLVNGERVKRESSDGNYSTASIHFQPKDFAKL